MVSDGDIAVGVHRADFRKPERQVNFFDAIHAFLSVYLTSRNPDLITLSLPMNVCFLRRGSRPPRLSRPRQIPVSKGSGEQRQGVHRGGLGPGPPSQLPWLHGLKDGVCDGG